MKKIIALQEYSDKYISLYEGEIRNIQDGIADKLIEQGIVAEHDDSDGKSGGNSSVVFIDAEWKDSYSFTLKKTCQEIWDLISSGKACFINILTSNVVNLTSITTWPICEVNITDGNLYQIIMLWQQNGYMKSLSSTQSSKDQYPTFSTMD